MKKLLLAAILLTICSVSFAQRVGLIGPAWLEKKRADRNNDTLYIVNFWATWCKPCVEEMPHFDQLTDDYKNSKVRVVFVSLDMRKDYETRVKPFVTQKKVRSEVEFMTEINANSWIDKVSTDWSGAIPATWFVRASDGFEHFVEGEMNEKELHAFIDQTLIKTE